MISIFLVYGYLELSYLYSTHHKIQNPVIFIIIIIIHTSRGTTTTLHFLLATKEVTDIIMMMKTMGGACIGCDIACMFTFTGQQKF